MPGGNGGNLAFSASPLRRRGNREQFDREQLTEGWPELIRRTQQRALDQPGALLVWCSLMASEPTTRLRGVLLALAAIVGALGPACQPAPPVRPDPAPSVAPAPAAAPDPIAGEAYIRWLVERSMLHQAELAARRYSGQGQLWQHPYATRSRAPPRRWPRCGSPRTRPRRSPAGRVGAARAWATRSSGASSARSASAACTPAR